MNTPKIPFATLLRSLSTLSLIFLCALSSIQEANAGTFSVSPVRIYMKPKDRAVAVTLVNEGEEPVVLQADINTWSQKPDGSDDLVLTEDLILSPPIIKLGPKAKQVVRLALLRPADESQQLIYRMIIREVPEITSPKVGIKIPVALALSMPVFVTPAAAKYEISCLASRKDAKTLSAMCKNTGSAYTQIRDVAIIRDNAALAHQAGGAYLLPGAVKTLDVKADTAIGAGPAQIKVTFDDGKSQVFETTLP